MSTRFCTSPGARPRDAARATIEGSHDRARELDEKEASLADLFLIYL